MGRWAATVALSALLVGSVPTRWFASCTRAADHRCTCCACCVGSDAGCCCKSSKQPPQEPTPQAPFPKPAGDERQGLVVAFATPVDLVGSETNAASSHPPATTEAPAQLLLLTCCFRC